MSKIKIFYCAVAIAFGAFIFVYGGYDDSPGAQLLGAVLVVAGIAGIAKSTKKISD